MGVLGVSLTVPSLADLLAPQDCLYSRTLRRDAHAETRIIGALREVIDVADKVSANAAVAALGGPDISVATMTGSSSSTIPRCAPTLKAASRRAPCLACSRLRLIGDDRPAGRR